LDERSRQSGKRVHATAPSRTRSQLTNERRTHRLKQRVFRGSLRLDWRRAFVMRPRLC